jgi:DNA polymerase III alpha subunit
MIHKQADSSSGSATSQLGRPGVPDPVGEHLLVLARDPAGYAALCRVITSAHLRGGEKGKPLYDLDEVVDELRGQVVLTGCRKGAVRAALNLEGPLGRVRAVAVVGRPVRFRARGGRADRSPEPDR